MTLTAPYGHDGAYPTLEGVLRHHLDPVASLHAYLRGQAVLPALEVGKPDTAVLDDPDEVARIAAANVLPPQTLTDAEIGDLLAFLGALTDQRRGRRAAGGTRDGAERSRRAALGFDPIFRYPIGFSLLPQARGCLPLALPEDISRQKKISRSRPTAPPRRG